MIFMQVFDFNDDPDPEGLGVNWEFLILSLAALAVLGLAVLGVIALISWSFY